MNQIFDLQLEPTEWLLLIDFMMISIVSYLFYRSDKDEKTYEGKEIKISSPTASKILIKSMFYGSLIIMIGTIFSPSKLWLSLWSLDGARILGAMIANIGVAIFVLAKIQLAESYSPCFNSYVPKKIVSTGIYRLFRHPIYVGNSLIFLGAFIALGSLFILAGLIMLVWVYRNAASQEELALKTHFKEYEQFLSQKVVELSVFKTKKQQASN
jgi:protein-S-isoprenylcysteine O-methyltransferase Ste14